MSEQRIVFTNPDGTVGVIIPAPGISLARAVQDVPATATAEVIVDAEALPADRLFRAAWTLQDEALVECPVKSKVVAHELRRAKRAAEFAPFDDVIAKRLPGEEEAEAERVLIRAKYAALQDSLDSAETVEELKSILKSH
jgi:hypothetical protein